MGSLYRLKSQGVVCCQAGNRFDHPKITMATNH